MAILNQLNRYRQQMLWSIRYEGIRIAGLRTFGKLVRVAGFSRSDLSWEPQSREPRFDAERGVDTAGFVSDSQLDMDPTRRAQAVRYEPTSEPEFHHVMSRLDIRYEDFEFVDFGSGKGRVLMMAAEYPFQRIVGVELSRRLHETALSNLARFDCPKRQCQNATSVCEDATEFELPQGAAVLYFYNPFNDEVLQRVSQQIEESLEQFPRDLVIVYNNPVHRAVFDEARYLKLSQSELDGHWLVYRAVASR